MNTEIESGGALSLSQATTHRISHPTFRNRIYLLARTIKVCGIRQAFHYYFSRLGVLLRERTKSHNGTTTNDVDRRTLTFTHLNIRSSNAKWGVHYAPSREDVFRQTIRNLPIGFEDYVFVDLGSGKGEVLLFAAGYGFRKIIGVEYSETLASIASANIRTATGLMCQNIECICADATQFEFSDDPCVLYLYNPFQGKVMDEVLQKVEGSLRVRPRDLWVIYVNPWEHRKFVRSRRLKTIVTNWDLSGWGFCIYRSINQ